jgi:succinoglycan biosynthesis protein ExoO
MPDASVIIAAWNAERTIAAAISSSLRQTGVSLEIIVADDASTDATSGIAAAFGDPRIIIIRNASNGGPAAARNAALAAAKGQWIAVLDADDTMQPGRLASLIGKAATHGLDIAADNMWVEPEGGRPRLFIPESLDGTFERVTFEKFCAHNALFGKRPGYGYLKPVFRSAFLRQTGLRYDTGLRVGEDFNLVAEALALGARYGRVRSAFYNYTVAAGSISHRLSTASASAMLQADDALLQRYSALLTAAQRNALLAHRRSLRDGVAFISMIDAMKQRDWRALAAQIWNCPAALRHFDMPVKARLARARQGLVRSLRLPVANIGSAEPVRAWGARR